MKRIILVLVVILISTNTLHAANFKWTKIVTTIDGATEFYIEKKSVKSLNVSSGDLSADRSLVPQKKTMAFGL